MNHNIEKLNQGLMEKIQLLLSPFPDSVNFVVAYKDYIHAIDDLIDEDSSDDRILHVQALASLAFSQPFWFKFGPQLIILEQLINNCYADSVDWELSGVEWKVKDSNVLRHAGIEMFFAVILITFGREKLREISSEFREQCHRLHMDENLKAV